MDILESIWKISMVWVVRTYGSKGVVAFGNSSSLIFDKEFDTRNDALKYRSSLKEYSELFELTMLVKKEG